MSGQLLLIAALVACAYAEVKSLEGYTHFHGDCEGFDISHHWHWNEDQCKVQCEKYLDCDGFFFVEKGNSKPGFHKWSRCSLKSHVCEIKDATDTDDTMQHMYRRIGFNSLKLAGWSSKPGKCDGVKVARTFRNYNPTQCLKMCITYKCRHFTYTHTRQCDLSLEECNANSDLVNADDGKTFVVFPDPATGFNEALYRTTSASSNYNGYTSHAKAVDGYNYPMASLRSHYSCWVSHLYHPNPWIKVTLGAMTMVQKIAITNRDDELQEEMKHIDLIVSTQTANTFKPTEVCATIGEHFRGRRLFDCQEPMAGQYVRVQAKDIGAKRRIAVCEIEVYAAEMGNLLEDYELTEKTYCNIGRMDADIPAYNSGKDYNKCAILCNTNARCAGFMSYFNGVCYFLFNTCPATATAHGHYSIYRRKQHPSFEVPGYTFGGGQCADAGLRMYAQFAASSYQNCAERCTRSDKCKAFYLNNANRYCYIVDKQCKTFKAGNLFWFNQKERNAAVGAPAMQMATYAARVPSLASDGVLSTLLKLGSCSQTLPAKITWWAVDLAFNTKVVAVEIWNLRDRGDTDNLKQLSISVTKIAPVPGRMFGAMPDELCAKRAEPVGDSARIDCKTTLSGRYVVVKRKLSKAAPLTLCEVAVYGEKDYDVHGYTRAINNPPDCTYMNVKHFKTEKYTPAQCGDECNKEKNCASFLYLNDEANPQCWLKARHCSKEAARPSDKYIYYDKIGHPGFSAAGYETRIGEYVNGYNLKNWGALDPAACSAKCEENPDCFGLYMHWVNAPNCMVMKEFDVETVRWSKADHYMVLIKKENNRAVNLPALASASFDQSEGYAVDGCTSPLVLHHSCARVQPVDGKTWWAVDLEKAAYVSGVKILSTKDETKSSVNSLVILVTDNKPLQEFDSTEVCIKQGADTVPKPGERLEITCTFPIVGRYVVVLKEKDEPVTLCEVLVDGELFTDENVALEKETDQISTESTGVSGKAVDGKCNTHLDKDTCAQTKQDFEDRNTWWSVDLGLVHAVSLIKIRNRGDCCGGELRKITIAVSSDKPDWNYEPHAADICNYRENSLPFNETYSVRCRQQAVGRYVIISKDIPRTDLVLCEVEVYGREIKPSCSFKNLQPETTCVARKKGGWCTGHPNYINWMKVYCAKTCQCRDKADALAFWPLIASYKAKDTMPGKSHGSLSDVKLVKSAVGPLDKPYTAFEILKDEKSFIRLPHSENTKLENEGTLLLYFYQSGFVDDSVLAKLDNGNLQLKIDGKKLVAVLMSPEGQEYRVMNSAILEPDTWYFAGMAFNIKEGKLSTFVDNKMSSFTYGTVKTGSLDSDIVIGGENFGGRVTCAQLYPHPMVELEVLAARAACKTYLKTPGDTAVNIAKGKPAFQSTTLMGAEASRATDGSDAPYFWRNSCTATVQGPAGMTGPHWWSVDLEDVRAITSVRVVNRMFGNPERLHDFRVLVTLAKPASPMGYDAADICRYHKGAMKGGQSKILSCKRSLPGRYVTVTKPDHDTLTLCEVEVFGELTLIQPESKTHSLFWQCSKIDDVRRDEKLIIRKEVSNIKLCYRACLLESSFKCTSIEYDRRLKWCRLYTANREMVADQVALEAALADNIAEKSAEQSTITNSGAKNKQRVSRIQRLQNSIAAMEKERERLAALGSDATEDTKTKIEARLLNDRQELKALQSGTVHEAGSDVAEEQSLGVRPHAELLYCQVVSMQGQGSAVPTCPKVNNKQTEKTWESKENWILNVFPDVKFTEVEHSWECRQMCEREKNFVCLSYAHNHELKTCSLWSVNPAVPGVDLISKRQSTYHQWSCQEQLPPCVCWIGGDPHYRTFDGMGYDNQGSCKYMTAEYWDKNDMCKFKAEHKNQKRGGGPSWITVMDINILGHTIRFTHAGQIWYDGTLVTDLGEANALDPRIQLNRIGKQNELSIPGCGVFMKYDGIWNYHFQLSRRKYAGKVNGLCGNCDGNRRNEEVDRLTGKTLGAGGRNKWIMSYEVFDDAGLNHVCKRIPEPTVCEGEWVKKVRQKDYCGLITDYSGPFGTCIRDRRIDQNKLFKDCEYDVCSFAHNPTQAKENACSAVDRVVEECAKLSLDFKPWRTAEFCPMSCGKNMEYSPKMSGCPASCADPEAPKTCTEPDQEGCKCMAGYILNDKGKCIVEEMCTPKCKNDIAFCLDQSEVMGSKLSASARDLVAAITDSFHIGPTSTQVSIVPYAEEPTDVILYNTHGSRAETVEAISNLRLLKGTNKLHKCVEYVQENIFTEELMKTRPEDTYIRTLVIVTGTDVAEDDAVTEYTKAIYRRGGKVFWIKYNSEKAPPPKELTISPFVIPVPDPENTEDLVDTFVHTICKESTCSNGHYSKRYTDYETCEDIDECKLEVCSAGSTCQNTKGAFKCLCPTGFCFNPITGCEEINECARTPCLPGSTCENTVGSYTCTCLKGYRYDVRRSCVDIDECTESDVKCDGDAYCENTPGSYKCTCPKKKWTYIPEEGCKKKNPCKFSKRCGQNSYCAPRKGGKYECVCPEGMFHEPKKGCLLKNACGDQPCHGDHVTCVQNAGGYECLCPNMNFYDPEIGCQPLDPCLSKPCKGQSKCTGHGTEFYCGCERGLYYNPAVGCEEPETRVPMVKVIMILDDSDKVGERVFEYIKNAAKQISVTLAGKSETLNTGIWLAGGQATVTLEMGTRPVDDYGEFISDIEFKGGDYKLEDVIALIKKNEGVMKDDYSQVIIVVITGNNVDHSSQLKPTCAKVEDNTENDCNHMVILYGHDSVKDPDDSYYILLQNAIELYGVHTALGEYTASWMTCPNGFVRMGDKCRIESSVLYKCKASNGEIYAADAIWTEDCITYKCVRNGATPIKGECRDAKGNCRPANGESYQCVLKGELREKCRCSVEIKNGEANRKVSYIEYTKTEREDVFTYDGTVPDGSKCHFPFYYQGELVYECTTRKSSTPWCATTDNWDVDQKWGFCKPGEGARRCEYDGKSYYEGQYWWRDCARFQCTEFGVQVKYPKCKSKGSTKCVNWGAEDFPCEINGKNYDACVCAGSKNKAELFAISSRETVEEAYGGGNAEAFCTMGDTEYQIDDTWEVDCSEFTCLARNTVDGGEAVGATVEAIRLGCKVETNAGQWICLDVGATKDDCGTTTEGEKRSCSCTQAGEGLLISYKTESKSWSVSAATSSYFYSSSSSSSFSSSASSSSSSSGAQS